MRFLPLSIFMFLVEGKDFICRKVLIKQRLAKEMMSKLNEPCVHPSIYSSHWNLHSNAKNISLALIIQQSWKLKIYCGICSLPWGELQPMLIVSFKFLTVALFSNQKSRLTWWIQSRTVLICSAHPPAWQNVCLSSWVTLSHPDMSNTYLVQTSDGWEVRSSYSCKKKCYYILNLKRKIQLKVESYYILEAVSCTSPLLNWSQVIICLWPGFIWPKKWEKKIQ